MDKTKKPATLRSDRSHAWK